MRAAVFHGVGRPLALEHVPDPMPAPGQVLIEVHHVGICGSDLHMTEVEGFVPPGAILGHEFAGTVIDPNGSGLEVGARVTALPIFPCWQCEECEAGHLFHCGNPRIIGVGASGAYAQAMPVDARLIQPLPSGVSFREGALIEPLAVGRRLLSFAGNLKGSTVLVLGAGPVGVAAIVFALVGGARHVVISEPSVARQAKAIEMGAHAVIDPTAEDLPARLIALCGALPDIVLECVGRPGMFAAAIAALRPRGQIISAGAGFAYDGFIPIEATVKEPTINFSAGYTLADFEAIVDAIATGRLNPDPMITDIVSFADLPEVFEALRRPTGQCKVLVDIA